MNEEQSELRDDVRRLGEVLGETLRSHLSRELYDKIETCRQIAKGARRGNRGDAAQLEQLLADLSPDETLTLTRAFSHFLNLVNIADQYHGVRRYHQLQDEARYRPELDPLQACFSKISLESIPPENLQETLQNLCIELVLTAHPTEITRRSLITKYAKIAHHLAQLDSGQLTAIEYDEEMDGLRQEIEAAWTTDEIRRRRPTPIDEARWGFAVIEHTLWDAVPRFLRKFNRQLEGHMGQSMPLDWAPIRFGSWMGGDRDGNPNVTPAVTQEVTLLARWMAADLYYREIEALRSELSMSECSDELRAQVGEAGEPYRELLREVRHRLAATRSWVEACLDGETTDNPAVYQRVEELQVPLQLCYDSLMSIGAHRVAAGRISDLLRRVACFGLTLIQLDIRQESERHSEALDQLTQALGLGSYLGWDESQRQAFLLDELQSRRPLIPLDFEPSDEVADVLDTFTMLAQGNRSSFGSYIISMARQPSDVLAVALLQKAAGIAEPLPIAPLFETLADLQHAGDAIDALLSLPWYQAYVKGCQEIMIGYSDSAKDAGIIAAAWAQYQAQENLLKVCQSHGVKMRLFHGRGGSVGRGGAPTQAALRSQPPGTVAGDLKVTEQGEVIRAKFGLAGTAFATLETYVVATLEATLLPPVEPTEAWRKMMQRLSQTAYDAYRSTVVEDSDFVPYFRAATPEVELSSLAIGSRPSRRSNEGGISSLRAIPWIFAWTQNRLILPAWLGVGEALEEVLDAGLAGELDEMRRGWPFFANLLDMLEMVLAKADPQVALNYDEVLVPAELKPLGERLRQRFDETSQAILRVAGHDYPLQGNPVSNRAIALRNPYTDPLNLLQIELLHQARQDNHELDPRLQNALMVTIGGIAAGMRNTG